MGQPVSFTFSVDQNSVALVIQGALALVGLGAAIYGALMAAAPGGWLGRRNWRYLLRELAAWDAISPGGDQAEAEELARGLNRLNGWSLVGGGLGAALAALAMVGLALAITGSVGGVMMGDLQFLFFTLYYQGFLLGMTAGYLIATRMVTNQASAAGGGAWAGLRPRRVSDYRAKWIGWGTWTLAALAVAPLLAVAALRLPLSVSINATDSRLTLPTLPAVAALSAWALAIPALAALACRQIAASPRSLTARDPRAARAADELRRALAINVVIGLTWISGGLTLMSIMGVAGPALAPTFGPLGIATGLLYLLGFLANLFGLGLNLLRGRLGGRVTGGRVSFQAMMDAIATATERT